MGYKCTRPNVEIDPIVIHNAQDEIFRPGKQHWKPVDFTFYEQLVGADGAEYNGVSERVLRWWGSLMIDLRTSTHNSPVNYLKNAELSMLDGAGYNIWTYRLINCWISKVSPSALSAASGEIAETTITLHYSKALEINPVQPY